MESNINEGYDLIPMSEITDEARQIAVAWMECEDRDWIQQKHKLASDIMNYAKKQVAAALGERLYTREEMEKAYNQGIEDENWEDLGEKEGFLLFLSTLTANK